MYPLGWQIFFTACGIALGVLFYIAPIRLHSESDEDAND